MTGIYVVDLQDLDGTRTALAGGKGANLGELMRAEGVRVPPGFVVTTEAAGADPQDVATAITTAVRGGVAYAVRSSATAEDSPSASFAGQHDSFLDVVGPAAVLEHVRRCWASLSTDRAVAYRRRHGLDGAVAMAVVVQEMVRPRVSGVLFTADPATGNRTRSVIEAAAGLGEALVSGHVDPERGLLTEAETARLEALGRRIEAHFGAPQDIEWCLDDDGFAIVQARPITTLFPLPVADDDAPRVYLSVGHQQMMTDAMKPLGLSLWQLTAMPRMHEAGSRLYVDATRIVQSPAAREAFVGAARTADPLTADALQTVIDRGFVPTVADAAPGARPEPPAPLEADPALVAELVQRADASNAALARAIRGRSGAALVDFIVEDVAELKRILFDPRSAQVYLSAMDASAWLNEHLADWLGETNAADTLTLSVPGNVTSEMGLALLDVADAIRADPQAVAALRQAPDDAFPSALPRAARTAVEAFLDRFGMRCVGEIDITRPRWRERPSLLVPLLLGNVETFAPGDGARRFAAGEDAAEHMRQDVLARLSEMPDGARKAEETGRMIARVRTFSGYREHPKSFIVERFLAYKQALIGETERLVEAGVLRAPDDAAFLTLAELREVARTDVADHARIDRRRRDFALHRTLTPPRVLTSEGEAVTGAYRRDDVPAGALTGLAVSRGTVEGRARVVADIADARLEPGDILVTAFTDPSWTPLFVAAAGLVTEVGGLMTHGAVIAREYGLPAVVGVQDATRLIEDGRRIRVHGTDGHVELLPAS